MKIINITLIIITTIILASCSQSSTKNDNILSDRSLYSPVDSSVKINSSNYLTKRKDGINQISLFESYKKPKIRALLIANQKYINDSESLRYSINDINVYKKILKYVIGCNEKNIYVALNLTLNQFNQTMKQFIQDIQSDELVLIVYAGHGGENGMPIFVDGKFIQVQKFHDYLNQFHNDTVIIMDSCYSGAEGIINQGITSSKDRSGTRSIVRKRKKYKGMYNKEIREVKPFRNNILRLYSSLSNQVSREGLFKQINSLKPYLGNTYKFLNQLGYQGNGNGIFTLLFSSFFAENVFSNENYNFMSLTFYIHSKTSELQEIGFPVQRPKMKPYHMPFLNKNNQYIFYGYQENVTLSEDEKNYLSATKEQNNNQYIPAIKLYQKNINYKDSRLRLADCYLKLSYLYYYSNPNLTISLLNKAIQYNPHSFQAINILARIYDEIKIQYNTALKYYDIVISLAQKTGTQYWIAIGYNNIGYTYDRMGQFKNALKYYRKSLKVCQVYLKKNFEVKSIVYNNLGVLYLKLNNQKKAIPYLKKSLKINKKLYGFYHHSTALSYNNLGVIYYNQKKYKLALKYYKNALKIYLKNNNIWNPNTALTYKNISTLYNTKKNYPKAILHIVKAILIYEKILGSDHPETAEGYRLLSNIYSSTKHYDKALNFYARALKSILKNYGENHLITAGYYTNIATIYQIIKQYNQAIIYYNKAQIIYENKLGKNHIYTAIVYNKIGDILFINHQFKVALPYYLHALQTFEKVFGKKHPTTGLSYFIIGKTYYNLGNFKLAKKYIIKSQKIFKTKLGTKHPYYKNGKIWLKAIKKALKTI